ncbi:hypothetical protein X757_13320 [Mesorhizobium sp. LSHC414A00]|nr:hypothetical protein X757_13320 [Mesorhizobium sp. LSHC414A00]
MRWVGINPLSHPRANSFPNPFNIVYARNVADLPRVLRCSIESGLT